MSAGLQVVYSKNTVTRECMEIERFGPALVEHLPLGICWSGSGEMINILMKYPCPVRKHPLVPYNYCTVCGSWANDVAGGKCARVLRPCFFPLPSRVIT